jgi:hypothetical protein
LTKGVLICYSLLTMKNEGANKMTTPEPVRLRFSKFGLLDDPRGGHAIFTLGTRDYLVEVTDVFCTPDTGYRGSSVMLRTRHLNGEAGPDVSPYIVKMLVHTYEAA